MLVLYLIPTILPVPLLDVAGRGVFGIRDVFFFFGSVGDY